MENRIIIRADGGRSLGLGHWSRCLFLLSCFKNISPDLSCVFFTRNLQALSESFPDERLEIVQLENEEELVKSVNSKDIILIDLYHFEPEYLRQLKEKNAFIIFVDDLLSPCIEADMIINHSPDVYPADYKLAAPYASFYLGGKFSLVPKVFNKSNNPKRERLGNLLLCMGGADPDDKTGWILQKNREELQQFENVYVILGPQYQNSENLKASYKDYTNINFLNDLSKQNIAALMQECGTALVPASTMALEYAHVGGILGVLQTADNQDRLYKGLLSEKIASPMEQALIKNGRSTLYDLHLKKQRLLFDGDSTKRFNKLFSEINTQLLINLRLAKIEDAELTYEWASDPEIRQYSFSQEKISWEKHQQWFAQKTNDVNCFYFIAEMENDPVGSVRFDIHNKEALISYLVDKHQHGKGLGRIILAEGIKKLLSQGKDLKAISGFVMMENVASIKVFERMGFERSAEEGKIKYYKKLSHG